MTVAELTLFGKFELRRSDGQVIDLLGQKERALLAILALSSGATLSRDKLASLLWSDRGDVQARDSLKHALTRIRQSLEEVLPGAILADRQSVRFDSTGVTVDVARFEKLVREKAPEALEEASALCFGELLDDISIRDAGFEAWLLAERQRLNRLLEEALTELLAPDLPSATRERAARRLLTLDSLRETAVRTLMQIHVARGETAQGIRLFESLRDNLQAELGVRPEAETARLDETIRQGRKEAAGDGIASANPSTTAPFTPAPSTTARPITMDEPALPSKPSIAVLAFENLSGDPEQEYFADGMVEEIITALSRMRWLFVIARNSSFTYRGRAVDVKQIGRELGVRYILEGSVRKATNRVRISGQLIDATTGAHLWADRFDGGLDEVFDLQDQVSASVVSAIAPRLEQAEIERSKRKPTESLDAYDHFLRGMACLHQWTRQGSDQALKHFYRAIELDPDYASAYGLAARCYSQRKVSGWTIDLEREIAEAARLARQVIEIGKDDAVALSAGGMALAYVVGDLDNGGAMIERSLVLNPNAAWSWLFDGWTKVWRGDAALALESIDRAMRMSPQDPQFFNMRTASAWAHFFAGRYDQAQVWAQSALREQPDYVNALHVLAAASALCGQEQEARDVARHLQSLDPEARISRLHLRYPLRRPEDLAKLADGLKLAGLPA